MTQLRVKPANIGEGLYYGGVSLVYGLYEGLTGIIMEPIRGAQREGGVGALKGLGMGLVGYVIYKKSY